MSNNNTAIKALLALLGVGALGASIGLVAVPKNNDAKVLESEISELQTRYDDLVAKEGKKDQFIEETNQFNAHFDDVVSNYPADLNQESAVMFFKQIETDNEVRNESFSMPQPSDYYILGQGAAADGVDTENVDEDSYLVQTVPYTISYSGTYDGLKDLMQYISNYKYRMTISQMSIAYADDAESPLEKCTGSLTLNGYSISGPDRTPDTINVDVKEGKTNIFEASSGGSTRSAVSYDQDNGESIISNHNLVVLLNNANNDTTSGIIVASNENDEKTYVTSSENEVETLKLSVYSQDDKNYLKYEIGSESYEAEITTTDVTVYVKSAARVDNDDTNGVDVQLTNTTAIPVYVKVVDDDSSNPRFSMSQKSGTVKTY